MEEPRSFDQPEAKPAPSDPPQMSEIATIFNVFIEPGRTFEDLKRKPRFIIGMIIIALLVGAYGFGLYYKVGDKAVRQMVVTELEKNAQVASMPADQKANMIELQMTIQKVVRFLVPVFVIIFTFLGGLFYFLGSKAFGGNGGFLHGVSVYVYSAIPPAIVSAIANLIVLIFKSADEIDIIASQRGVIHANPGMFIDGKAQPVLATILSTFDIFAIWGWVLAAIGLRITNKLSSGSAWGIVIIIALLGTLGRVFLSFVSGNPS